MNTAAIHHAVQDALTKARDLIQAEFTRRDALADRWEEHGKQSCADAMRSEAGGLFMAVSMIESTMSGSDDGGNAKAMAYPPETPTYTDHE